MHDERNLAMMRTRSYESEVLITFTHPQQALITGVAGQVIFDEQEDAVDFVVTEIDPAEADRIRSNTHSHLKDRRPDVYEGL